MKIFNSHKERKSKFKLKEDKIKNEMLIEF